MAGVVLQSGMEPYPGYRLQRLLGSGGFGEVWKAETKNGRVAALKFLTCDGRQSAARELRSLQAICRLSHPHLIKVERVWCFGGYVVVAMERASGSLADLCNVYLSSFGTPIVPEHACLLLSEAAEALDFLNTRQHDLDGQCVAFQHCDIKPSNLLLFGETLKVADFGLATPLTARLEIRSRAGTVDYCAPEVFQGRVSSSTDQYALAVTYCQVRGGRLPFTDTPATLRSDYVRPTPDLSMLSAAERPILARGLNPVPQDRWPTCGEMMARLSQVACHALEIGQTEPAAIASR
jgi:serine/threonine protein kinase, bacterial